MKTRIMLWRRPHRDPVEAVPGARIEAISREVAEWHGVRVEVGRNEAWAVDDLMFDGHFVAFNVSDTPLRFEARLEQTWAPAYVPGKSFWILPEGRSFSVRSSQQAYWAIAVIDGVVLDSLLGAHYQLNASCGVTDDVLSHLFQAVVALVVEGCTSDARLTKAAIQSFLTALATRHGSRAEQLAHRGLLPDQLQSLLRWIDENLGNSLTVEQMASRVLLSPAYFSRAFKQATGATPWGYVVGLRLERAAMRLKQGESASVVAEACGFADQAHLSRLFKRRFGVSPVAFSISSSNSHCSKLSDRAVTRTVEHERDTAEPIGMAAVDKGLGTTASALEVASLPVHSGRRTGWGLRR